MIAKANYTVIAYPYAQVNSQTKRDLRQLLHQLKTQDPQSRSDYLNQLILIASHYFLNRPYNKESAGGEGAVLNKPGRYHVQQNPLYRTDNFDCTTFVQDVLALIHTGSVKQYNQHILQINYGVGTLLFKQNIPYVSYANRNNFISGGFNLVNQRRSLLKDVTSQPPFTHYVKYTSTVIDRAGWFHQLATQYLEHTVRILPRNLQYAGNILKKFQHHYGVGYPKQKVSIAYIPKTVLINPVNYQPNNQLLNQIPTPSVVEIVRDDNRWQVNGMNVKRYYASGLSVSHIALLYRQRFSKGQLIYHRTTCNLSWQRRIVCKVSPVFCNKPSGCHEIMMAAATDPFPDGFVWSYNQQRGSYYCTPPKKVPSGAHVLKMVRSQTVLCNRVMVMPLGDYLARYSYGMHLYMQEPSILGINIQKII